jgi:uncharacterized protein YukE
MTLAKTLALTVAILAAAPPASCQIRLTKKPESPKTLEQMRLKSDFWFQAFEKDTKELMRLLTRKPEIETFVYSGVPLKNAYATAMANQINEYTARFIKGDTETSLTRDRWRQDTVMYYQDMAQQLYYAVYTLKHLLANYDKKADGIDWFLRYRKAKLTDMEIMAKIIQQIDSSQEIFDFLTQSSLMDMEFLETSR